MKSKLISILTVICMIVGSMALFALPVSAATESRTLYYNTSDSKLHYDSLDGTAVGSELTGWSGNGTTLTLNGFNYVTTADKALVLPFATTTLDVIGANSITTNAAGKSTSHGVYTLGTIGITGSGSLNVISKSADENIAIFANQSISIDGAAVKASAGYAVKNGAMAAGSGIVLYSGSIDASAAEVSSVEPRDNVGISATSITVRGGWLKAKAGGDKGFGLLAQLIKIDNPELGLTSPENGKTGISSGYSGLTTVTLADGFTFARVVEISSNKSAQINFTGDPADVNDKDKGFDVQGKVIETGRFTDYCVDIEWGHMKFVYSNNRGTWDTEAHTYTGGTENPQPTWWPDNSEETGEATESYLDGVNNLVRVTNHSNNAIDATFIFTMLTGSDFAGLYSDAGGTGGNATAFNSNSNDENAVVGGFYNNKEEAAEAAKLLNSPKTSGIFNTLTGGKIELSTAIGRDPAGNECSKAVFFAFSGTPDVGSSKVLPAFRKVGIIMVTIVPNGDAGLNQPGNDTSV